MKSHPKYLLVLAILIILLSIPIRADIKLATDLIIKHEGFRSKPYIDTSGFSIGYGTNLAYGISEAEALLLLTHRLAILEQRLLNLHWFRRLSPVRKAVILDLTYNIGYTGLHTFKGMIWCLKNNHFNAAANHMRDSLWFKQTGTRAKKLIILMKEG